MKYTDINYTNASRTPFALSNMCNNCTTFDVTDAIEDATSSADLCSRLNAMASEKKLFEHNFKVERETQSYIRLSSVDTFGNIHYLIVYNPVFPKQ